MPIDLYSLSRDERRERIADARDAGVCSVCSEPLLDGQPRNGLVHSHWDCCPAVSDSVPSFDEINSRVEACGKAINNLRRQLNRK